jgi:hypothetical protein
VSLHMNYHTHVKTPWHLEALCMDTDISQERPALIFRAHFLSYPRIVSTSTLWNPEVHHRLHNSQAVVSMLNHLNPPHIHPISLTSNKPEGRGFESRWGGFFFNWPNPSSYTMALGSTQPLTERSTRKIPGG